MFARIHHTITPPRTDHEWDQTIQLLKRVYVGEGFTTPEGAANFMKRSSFEEGGEQLLAIASDGTVIGSVLFLFPNGPLGQVAEPGEAELRVLAVAPEVRSQGVGEALIQACVERARANGSTAMVLWSQPTMLAAHRLYLRMGFERAPARDRSDARCFTRMVFRKVL